MYSFQGKLFGFGSLPTDHEAARLRNHLEAFVADTIVLYPGFRTGRGDRLPRIEESRLAYFDPGNVDPPMQDGVTTFLEGGGACGPLSVYAVSLHRIHGEHATFEISVVSVRNPETGRLENRWHIRERRANGRIDDWSRLRGMKG